MFLEIVIKTAIVHTLTYFVVGVTAFTVFNYAATLAHPANNMKPPDDPLVRAATLFQPIRGIIFGVILYLLRGVVFFGGWSGWLIVWIMFVGIGIIGTFAPTRSSIEGFIFLKSSEGTNWGGLVEILLQSLLLSFVTWYWVVHPEDVWLSWVLGILFVLTISASTFGLLETLKKRL